jgi:uroporphyrinogen-III synthase
LALGSRIADAAGDGWAKLHIAEQPSDGALIELAAQLCKKTGIDGLSHG